MSGTLIALGIIFVAYAMLGRALRGRERYRDADTKPLAALAQARRDPFVRLAQPLGVLGVLLLVTGAILMAIHS